MNTVAIIQARYGSTRLPGKVLMDLAGAPMLVRVVNRVQRANTLDNVVIATTTEPSDESIVTLCLSNNWPFFRGSELDVLDRYYQAAKQFRADIVVRITSDCPMIEPEIIDQCVQMFVGESGLDYLSNTLSMRTYPRGLDTEVIASSALARAWSEDKDPRGREHVTPYIYRHPELFHLKRLSNDVDLSKMRWTVDTSEDLMFAQTIYEHFGTDEFYWKEVLSALREHPKWLKINNHVRQKHVP